LCPVAGFCAMLNLRSDPANRRWRWRYQCQYEHLSACSGLIVL